MPDYSLVPVDHQPDFDDYSFVPVDHDPFSGEDATQQAQTQAAQPQPQSPPQQPAPGVGVSPSNVGAPAVNSQAAAQSAQTQIQPAPTYNNPEDEAAMSPETYVNPFVKRVLGNLVTSAVTLPQRAIDAARVSFERNYGPGPATMSDFDVWVDPLPAVAAETALMLGGVGASRAAGLARGAAADANALRGGRVEGRSGVGVAGSGDPPASSFSGSRANPLQTPDGPPRNAPGEFNGRPISGHAFDQLQNRGLPPSVVDEIIKNGTPSPGNRSGTTRFYDPTNNISVVRNDVTGNIITIRSGD